MGVIHRNRTEIHASQKVVFRRNSSTASWQAVKLTLFGMPRDATGGHPAERHSLGNTPHSQGSAGMAFSAMPARVTPPAARNPRRFTCWEPSPIIPATGEDCADANRWIAGRRRRSKEPAVRETAHRPILSRSATRPSKTRTAPSWPAYQSG